MGFQYLTLTDFYPVIQPGQLEWQITQNNIQTLWKAEGYALQNGYSILTQRYNIAAEYQPISPWEFGVTYSAAQRTILDYATFSSTTTYTLGDCVIVPNSVIWNNTNFNPIGEAWCLTGATSYGPTTSGPTTVEWTPLGYQYQIFYVNYPQPLFNYLNNYIIGQDVFFENQIWECMKSTPTPNETYAEQFVSINAVPRNVIPTDTANNNYSWWAPQGGYYTTPLVGMTYSIGTYSIGTYSISDTLPTNNQFWTDNDNRDPLMVLSVVNLTLFYLHKNIQPTNVPEHRMKAYKEALNYFEDLAFGKKNSPMLVLQPQSGLTINFGGNSRLITRW